MNGLRRPPGPDDGVHLSVLIKRKLREWFTEVGPFYQCGAAGFAAAWCIYKCCWHIKPGYAAVTFNRFSGVPDTVVREGWHFYPPFVSWPIPIDIRVHPQQVTVDVTTKDEQPVTLGLRVLCQPDVAQLPAIYRNFGCDCAQIVVPPVLTEVLKQTAAEYDAAQLLKQRVAFTARLRERVGDKIGPFGMLLEDAALTEATFSKEFARAMEQKQLAEQQARRAA